MITQDNNEKLTVEVWRREKEAGDSLCTPAKRYHSNEFETKNYKREIRRMVLRSRKSPLRRDYELY